MNGFFDMPVVSLKAEPGQELPTPHGHIGILFQIHICVKYFLWFFMIFCALRRGWYNSGMDQPSSFEQSLEADMSRLASEISIQRERPEMQNAAEQELVKEAIRAFPELKNQSQAAGALGTAVPVPQSQSDANSPLPAYAQGAPAQTKLEIEYLLDIALKKGIGPALAQAQKSPPFVQDAFHDALAGRLYPELQKRGIVK